MWIKGNSNNVPYKTCVPFIWICLILSLQSKAKLVDPIDYETVIVKNKTLLHNDPEREMLIFPHDDVSVSKTTNHD